MTSKTKGREDNTSIRTSQKTRKRLKRITGILDIKQEEVINKALDLLEKDLNKKQRVRKCKD